MPALLGHPSVPAAPVKVIGAMVDFSDRRPEVWPALTARLYQLHERAGGQNPPT
ncbi:MAG: hypothetical protein WAW17_07660 [Rhodococcus sp. (in: high G+C Gram-positive bacteria)]